ncbi:Flp family type IVb pilin [Sphingomonas sp.]|uniref:Flp family type IVb pilin n=1 Tax=Sphingomonas sp. TaxID=28214 RepID=UPI002DD65BE2|nr:Flp family type IVb pilin [Sphingomonas sp.]
MMSHRPRLSHPRFLAALLRNRKGATAVEYGLILALIVLGLMTALVALGSTTKETWGNLHTKVRDASGG